MWCGIQDVQCGIQDTQGPDFLLPAQALGGRGGQGGGTYIQEILHGRVQHHQVREEGAKVGNGALHHTLWGQKGQVGSAELGPAWAVLGMTQGQPWQTHHLSLLLLPLLSPLWVDLQGGKFGCALLDDGEKSDQHR